MVLAVAASAGTLLGGTPLGAWLVLWLGVGTGAAIASLVALGGGRVRVGRAALGIAIGGLTTAWSGAAWHRMAADDIARIATAIGDQPTLIRLRGVVEEAPRLQARRGVLASFDRRPPRWRLPLRVTAILRSSAEGDRVEPASGRVWISVGGGVDGGGGASSGSVRPEIVPVLAAGESIEAFGRLSPFQPPMNPGEFDARRWARGEGLGGVLWVDSPALLRRIAPTDDRDHADAVPHAGGWTAAGSWRWVWRLRGGLASVGETTLEEGLPSWLDAEHRALLRAMFLGRRDDALADLEAAFQRTGAIHLIAISGFNMAVLATTTLLIVRRGGATRRWHALAVAALVGVYLLMVESQPAVLRAGAMILVFCVGEALGRRWTMRGVVSVAALILLVGSPARLENAGFQLSFAVVAALAWIAPMVRRRWFGTRDLGASTIMAVGREAIQTAVAAATSAWLVSTPLTIHHFGMISPLGAPLSLVAIPLASLLLAAGYAKMLVTLPLPWLGSGVGVLVAVLAETLASLIRLVDELPGAVIHVPQPGGAWTCAALATVSVWGLRRGRGGGMILLATVVLSIWLLWPLRPWRELPLFRLDALAVGDGTAILLRSGASAVLFDAGGGSSAVGERTIVPALRALGVRRLDAIILSHANMDHYAGLPEVVAALPVGQLIVNEATLSRVPWGASAHAGSARSLTPIAVALAECESRGVPLRVARRGDRMRLGHAAWTWLHPPEGWVSRGENDTSQVIRIEVSGGSVLLCGDIEGAAIEALRPSAVDALRADVIELPHHGSWNPAAAELVRSVSPRIVVQSTGSARWRRDRWGAMLEGVKRLVTARDGACTVELDRAGMWRVRRWHDVRSWRDFDGRTLLPTG